MVPAPWVSPPGTLSGFINYSLDPGLLVPRNPGLRAEIPLGFDQNSTSHCIDTHSCGKAPDSRRINLKL